MILSLELTLHNVYQCFFNDHQKFERQSQNYKRNTEFEILNPWFIISWPLNFEPSLIFIGFWEGVQNFMAAIYWTPTSNLHCFWRRGLKNYSCSILNPLPYLNSQWTRSLKFYDRDILTPPPLIFIAIGEAFKIFWTSAPIEHW